MELTFDYIKAHEDDFLPKENIDYCGSVLHYHYNEAHGEWTKSGFSYWTDDDDIAFKKWYKENITPVWAFMPVIVNDKVSGKVVEGFIIKNYSGGLEFTASNKLNSKEWFSYPFAELSDKRYQYKYATFHMFDNKKEAEEMYKGIVAKLKGEAAALRIKSIDYKVKELTNQIKKLKAEKEQLLSYSN